jgi:BCD family chlorophyll transporter-like MFS transporter
VFMGMLTVGIAATGFKIGALRSWVIGGCIGSAAALVAIAMAGVGSLAVPLVPLVVGLGFFNGMFAVAAIGSMMALASEGRGKREGTRMGLWGAAQAIAAGFGGLFGAAAVDVMRASMADGPAFGAVFLGEAGIFLAAAFMALHVMKHEEVRVDASLVAGE